MFLTYNNQTVDLFSSEYWPDGPPEKMLFSVSGGLDSAALLYLSCKFFPEMKKYVFTGNDVWAPFDALRAQDVVQWMQSEFPNQIFEHEVIDFDDRSPEILAEMKVLVEEDPSYFDKYPWIEKETEEDSWESFLGKIAKPTINFRNTRMVMEKYGIARYAAAMTQNPPDKDMIERGFYDLSETKRNEGREDVHVFRKNGSSYHPFARVNKKFVAGVFEEHQLMEDLYPLTGSCTGGPRETDWFTKPCGFCFWCHEKKWAFGEL